MGTSIGFDDYGDRLFAEDDVVPSQWACSKRSCLFFIVEENNIEIEGQVVVGGGPTRWRWR